MKVTMKSENIYKQKGGEKRMKYSKLIIAIVVAGLALGTYISSQAAEDVRKTRHNLSSSSVLGPVDGLSTDITADRVVSDATEVCVFCHTPHGGNSTVGEGAAPLWNRALPVKTTDFVPYDSPNFDANFANTGGFPKGVSIACLSCHDGTVAFDQLNNFPGSGAGSAANITITDDAGNFITNEGFGAGAEPYPNLGQDFSNDHPISIEVPCSTDLQFSQICTTINGQSSSLADGKVAFVSRDGADNWPSDKRDRLRVYPTDGGTSTNGYVECASCHNPHESTSSRFLRYPSTGALYANNPQGSITNSVLDANRNAGSLLCLSCHQK